MTTNLETVETPQIEAFTTNLSHKIQADRDDYVIIGRESETTHVIESLMRRTKNSPVLIGEPGVGKTAIVEKLAMEILDERVPSKIQGMEIVELSIAALQGPDFIHNFDNLLSELKANLDQYILFIDEVHMIMGAGDQQGSLDIGNLLKPALARGDFMIISATTADEYHQFIRKDGALDRRFQPVQVNEPSIDESIRIMSGLKPVLEDYYQMSIHQSALKNAITISNRYITAQYLPDKAIDLVEGAAARLVLEKGTELTTQDVLKQVEQVTGIPATSLNKTAAQRSLEFSKALEGRVMGQPRAIKTISKRVQKVSVGHNDPNRPLGVEFLLGPSGTGKTELVKTMAEVLFDSEDNMLRFDMSEYKDSSASSKFIERATSGIIKNPYTIVLLDEIEKASEDVFDLLLQILQDGVLTNAQGKTAVFRNAYIVMTSNEGFKFIDDQMNYKGIPEGEFDETNQDIIKGIEKELKNRFRPELVNRIDDTIIFNPLSKSAVRSITKKRLAEYAALVQKQNGWLVTYDQNVVEYIADTAYEPENGARPIGRTISRLIDNVIVTQVLERGLENPNAKYRIHIETKLPDDNESNSLFDRRALHFKRAPIS